MPKIVKSNEQEIALKTITENLKIIAVLNRILENEDIQDCNMKLTGMAGEKKVSEGTSVPYSLLKGTLQDYRQALTQTCREKSKKHSILLDEDDLNILEKRKENQES